MSNSTADKLGFMSLLKLQAPHTEKAYLDAKQ